MFMFIVIKLYSLYIIPLEQVSLLECEAKLTQRNCNCSQLQAQRRKPSFNKVLNILHALTGVLAHCTRSN